MVKVVEKCSLSQMDVLQECLPCLFRYLELLLYSHLCTSYFSCLTFMTPYHDLSCNSNQLQKYRLAHPVYTRSADGFSLHRSGVVSKSGANLKWTKSLGTQSILASEVYSLTTSPSDLLLF